MVQDHYNHKGREAYRFDFGKEPVQAELERYYWVDDSQLSCAFSSCLPARLADLVDLAMSVYYADRRAVRDRRPYVLTGLRDFDIRLPVRDLELWCESGVATHLTDLLHWSSQSAWETLTETFPELREIQEETVRHKDGNPQEIAAAYVQMYLTYVTEWERFPLGALATTR